jgi:hypothetical protein
VESWHCGPSIKSFLFSSFLFSNTVPSFERTGELVCFAVAAVPAVTLPAAVPALSQPGGPSRTHCRDGREGALLLHQPGASPFSFFLCALCAPPLRLCVNPPLRAPFPSRFCVGNAPSRAKTTMKMYFPAPLPPCKKSALSGAKIYLCTFLRFPC